jgi:hypothetical protein
MIGGVMNKKSWSAAMIIPLAAATVVSTAPAATAVVPRTDTFARAVVRDVGVCSGQSEVTLTARTSLRGEILLNLRLVSNRAGQVWRVRINQNGMPVASQVALTRPILGGIRPPALGDPSLGDPVLGDPVLGDPALGDPVVRPLQRAAFTVRAVARNMAGVDRFAARATNARSGETCTARVLVRSARPIGRPPIMRPPFVRPPIVRPPFGG